jgi:hypothetical protein
MEREAQDPVPRVVDHVGFAVADYDKSKRAPWSGVCE